MSALAPRMRGVLIVLMLSGLVAGAASAQDSRKKVLDLGQVRSQIDAHRKMLASKKKDPFAQHAAAARFRGEMEECAARLDAAKIRTPEDSKTAAEVLLEADRGKESVPYVLKWMKSLTAPKPDPPKPAPPKPAPPKPQPGRPIGDPPKRGNRAAEGEALRKGLDKTMEDMKETLALTQHFLEGVDVLLLVSQVLRCDIDETSCQSILGEVTRIVGPGRNGFYIEGAMAMPVALMRLRGVDPAKVSGLVTRYGALLAPHVIASFDEKIGVIGKTFVLPPDAKRLGGEDAESRPALEGRVTVVHVLRPEEGDEAIPRIAELVAAKSGGAPVSLIGVTFLAGMFVQPEKRSAVQLPLSEEDEITLLTAYRESHRSAAPWYLVGRIVETPESKERKMPPTIEALKIGSLPTFLVLDRAGAIRYVHTGTKSLGMIGEAIDRLLADGAANTRPGR